MSPIDVSPRDLVAEAERELAMGHFIKATSISRKAGKLVDRIEELHLRFIGLLKKAIQRTDSMEDMGYDVSEARTLIFSSKDLAMKSDYESALMRIKAIKRTLNRATYLPFPLLNKNVDIISTALWAGTAVDYAVRIENPSSEPLGEIIIRPFFEDGMFHDVPERHYGNIGPRSFSESTFRLIPKGKSFDIGIDSTLLQEDSVVFRTRFSSRHGKATYSVTIENNSDQIIRDIGLAPRPPGGLVPDPQSAMIEFIEPFGSRTVEFTLSPASIEKEAVEMEDAESASDQPPKERVVRIEEPNEFMVVERTKADRTMPVPKHPVVEAEEVANPTEVWDESTPSEPPRMKKHVPRDFSPQDEDYDLMLMSPYAYPESVSGKVGKGDRKREKHDQVMEESV